MEINMLPRVNVIRCETADYLLFSTNDAITASIYIHGNWEQYMTSISRQFFEGIDLPLVLDIGANLGGYSIPIAKELAGCGGAIYAYEPQRIIFYQLRGNLFLNRIDNVYAFNMAIGDVDGMVNIPSIDYAKSHNIGSFSLDERFQQMLAGVNIASDGAGNMVPLSRLDSLSFPKAPCLIKIDVEGLELEVLRGGQDFLRKHGFPPIILEAWKAEWFKDKRLETLEFLRWLGYETFEFLEEVIAQHPGFTRSVALNLDHTGVIHMQRTR
jgi:FkbM family methyltransferase